MNNKMLKKAVSALLAVVAVSSVAISASAYDINKYDLNSARCHLPARGNSKRRYARQQSRF